MQIFTQVVDSTYGKSAAGVRARLARALDDGWSTVAEAETNIDGCVEEWTTRYLERGIYRIVFDSDGYFSGLGGTTAYPEVVIIFRMDEKSPRFQVQVTISPYSYSTYFGASDGQEANYPGAKGKPSQSRGIPGTGE
jgi:5-hydroxyisourate hydrolase